MKSFSITDAFRFGWETFKKEWTFYIGITFLVIAISAIARLIAGASGLLGFVLMIGAILLEWWLYAGVTRITLRAHAGLPVSFEMLFGESWDTLYRFALAMIVAGILIVVGYVLLIVPGVIVQVMLLLFAFAIVDKGMGPIDALKESRRLTKGNRWQVFWFLLLMVLANAVGAMLAGVGLLVSLPVSLLALTYVYKALDKRDDVVPAPAPAPAPVETPTAAV